MEHRGRKSGAELAIISSGGIVSVARPEPLAEMTDEQAGEWREIVNRLPADWFPRETWAMLAQYCRHVVSSRRVAALIRQAESEEDLDIVTYDRLLKMQEREGRALSSLATRMRISQQATMSEKKRKPAMTLPKPWEGK